MRRIQSELQRLRTLEMLGCSLRIGLSDFRKTNLQPLY